ncbi:MAG: hypothetical protein P8165_09330 [Deltaproteobacteria bacterium]|jgi:hypothetical protein
MGHSMTKGILFLIMLWASWGLLISVDGPSNAGSRADPWAEVTFYVR